MIELSELAGRERSAQEVARTMEGAADAKHILQELHSRIDVMDGDRAEALVELLTPDYRG